MKRILITLFVAIFFFSLTQISFAQTNPTDIQQPVVEEINTFDLFWPIVAGRTRGDSLYSLKILKENVRGSLIFSNTKKSDYYVFLLTKRTVEADKLLKDGKTDEAKDTVGDMETLVAKADVSVGKAKQKNESFGESGPEMVKRLENIQKLIAWLSVKDEKNAQLFKTVGEKITSLKAKL
ncbi:MAG: DUF5667 domain-containing protein [Patescibacteria group bacterium]